MTHYVKSLRKLSTKTISLFTAVAIIALPNIIATPTEPLAMSNSDGDLPFSTPTQETSYTLQTDDITISYENARGTYNNSEQNAYIHNNDQLTLSTTYVNDTNSIYTKTGIVTCYKSTSNSNNTLASNNALIPSIPKCSTVNPTEPFQNTDKTDGSETQADKFTVINSLRTKEGENIVQAGITLPANSEFKFYPAYYTEATGWTAQSEHLNIKSTQEPTEPNIAGSGIISNLNKNNTNTTLPAGSIIDSKLN
jgi:hypothetical protein